MQGTTAERNHQRVFNNKTGTPPIEINVGSMATGLGIQLSF